VWHLSGVQFDDGAIATGYFMHDDTSGPIPSWNIRVSGGAGSFIPHTYVRGNSEPARKQPGTLEPYFYLYAVDVDALGPRCCSRSLWIQPRGPFDGESATLTIDLSFSGEYFEDRDNHPRESRKIAAGSLVRSNLPPTEAMPPITYVQVDEFYHSGLDHYFITADPMEKANLDTGRHPGWVRTGESFKAYATGSPGWGSINPVCRFYSDAERGFNSHFYSATTRECWEVSRRASDWWRLESDNVFQIEVPDTAGACPVFTIPVYRLWNRRIDSNHRYTTSVAVRQQMVALGYIPEGYGPNGVAMCAAQ
jgi:hypothetical protein